MKQRYSKRKKKQSRGATQTAFSASAGNQTGFQPQSLRERLFPMIQPAQLVLGSQAEDQLRDLARQYIARSRGIGDVIAGIESMDFFSPEVYNKEIATDYLWLELTEGNPLGLSQALSKLLADPIEEISTSGEDQLASYAARAVLTASGRFEDFQSDLSASKFSTEICSAEHAASPGFKLEFVDCFLAMSFRQILRAADSQVASDYLEVIHSRIQSNNNVWTEWLIDTASGENLDSGKWQPVEPRTPMELLAEELTEKLSKAETAGEKAAILSALLERTPDKSSQISPPAQEAHAELASLMRKVFRFPTG